MAVNPICPNKAHSRQEARVLCKRTGSWDEKDRQRGSASSSRSVDALPSTRRLTMTSPLLLSLTQHTLHGHNLDLEPVSIPNSAPTAVAASPTHVAEGSQSGSLILRDPFTLQPIHTLSSHTSSVTTLATSTSYLAAGHADGTVSLHNLSSHDHASFTEASSIISVAFPTTSRHLAAATTSAIALFSTVSNRLITRLTQPATRSYPRIAAAQARFTAVAFSPIYPTLLAATDDTGCLTVYDISTVLSSSRTHPIRATPTSSTSQSKFPSALKAPSTDLSFAPDGHLAVAGFDKLVRIFNPSLKQLLFTVAIPSPISAVCFETDIAVGLTDASIAIVRVDLKTSSGSVTKRVSVDTGVGAGGSRGVKRILYQPRPKRRKPPRSATPLNISPHEVSDEMFAEFDDIIGGKVNTRTETFDDDLFSPVKKDSARIGHLAAKSASFHASPGQRQAATPRSKSVQSITTQGHALEEDKLLYQTSIGRKPLSSKDANFNAFFDEDLHEDDVVSSKLAEDSFEGITKQSNSDNGSEFSRHESRSAGVSSRPDMTSASKPHAHTSSSVEIQPYSTQDNGIGKLAKSMSEEQTMSPPRQPEQHVAADDRNGRTVRFEYLNDVILGQPGSETLVNEQPNISSATTSTLKIPLEAPLDSGEHEKISSKALQDQQNSCMPQSIMHSIGSVQLQPLSADGKASTASQLSLSAEDIRDIVRQEIDVIRTDLRSDILNIHAELITLSTRQSQEAATVLRERDHTIKRLEEEVRRLDANNKLLRRKYGLGYER